MPSKQTGDAMADEKLPTDYPADNDSLGIDSDIGALVEFITNSRTPVSIAIQGDWGSGKTSIMKMIDGKLKIGSGYQSIWLSAWDYFLEASDANALQSIMLTMVQSIASALSWDQTRTTALLITKLKDNITSFSKTGFRAYTAVRGGGTSFDDLSKEYAYWTKEYKDALKNELGNHRSKAVIFLDDLDRLDPVRSLTILEGLKVLMDLPNLVFVVAIDKDVIREGCRKKYGLYEVGDRDLAEQYYDKFFQLSFNVPIDSYEVWDYIQEQLDQFNFFSNGGLSRWRKELEAVAILATGKNPRSLRLLLNSYYVAMSRQTKPGQPGDWQADNRWDAQCVMTFALSAMDRFKRRAFHVIFDSKTDVDESDGHIAASESLSREEHLLIEIYQQAERIFSGLGGNPQDVKTRMASSELDTVSYDGKEYDASHDYQDALGNRLIGLIREYGSECGIGDGKRSKVLDAGCGGGDFTRAVWLEDKTMTVHGIDKSGSQLDVANRKWIDYVARNPGVDGECITFEEKKIQDLESFRSYDVVVSNFAMHWLYPSDEAKKGYEKLAAALKDGGYMFVQQGCEGGFSGLHSLARECIQELGFVGKYKDKDGRPISSPDEIEFQKWSPSLDEFKKAVGNFFAIEQCDMVVEVLKPTMTLAENFVAASLLFYRNDINGNLVLNERDYKALTELFLRKCERGFDASDRNIVAVLKKKGEKVES